MNWLQAREFVRSVSAMTNPRQRRAFLDSCYAELVHGAIMNCDAGAVEELVRKFAEAGFPCHAARLLDHPHYRNNALKVTAIGTTFYPNGSTHFIALSLGEKIISSGPDWTVSAPVGYCVVREGKFQLGQLLPCLPAGAMSIEDFFGAGQ
jgi:hypothetical protein